MQYARILHSTERRKGTPLSTEKDRSLLPRHFLLIPPHMWTLTGCFACGLRLLPFFPVAHTFVNLLLHTCFVALDDVVKIGTSIIHALSLNCLHFVSVESKLIPYIPSKFSPVEHNGITRETCMGAILSQYCLQLSCSGFIILTHN